MAKLDASAVATLLVEIGQRLVLAGENPYKARAYSRAAQNLLTLTLPLGEVIAAGRLREIPGVGEALAATIEQLYARGTTPKLEARAVSNPFTTILGHLTGRMLLRRPGYEVDIDAILSACASTGSLSKSMRTLTGSIWTGDGT